LFCVVVVCYTHIPLPFDLFTLTFTLLRCYTLFLLLFAVVDLFYVTFPRRLLIYVVTVCFVVLRFVCYDCLYCLRCCWLLRLRCLLFCYGCCYVYVGLIVVVVVYVLLVYVGCCLVYVCCCVVYICFTLTLFFFFLFIHWLYV